MCVLKRNLRNKPAYKVVPRTERRLDVAILGAPNAGKSVLLNSLIREKLAATTRKSFTTRMKILGVYNHNNIQLAFFDTPGFERSQDTRKQQARALRDLATSVAEQADIALLVVDAAKFIGPVQVDSFAELAKIALASAKIEIILVLNKVDLVNPKSKLLDITRTLVSIINGVKHGEENKHLAALDTATFMISALEDDGVVDLKNYLLTRAVSKKWLLSKENGKTDLKLEDRIKEIILEKLLENTHDELPYIAEIECTSIKDIGGRSRIDVDIIVDSGAQQRIVIGQQGRTLVKIRQASVEVLEEVLKKEIILFIWVKTRGDKKKNDDSDLN